MSGQGAIGPQRGDASDRSLHGLFADIGRRGGPAPDVTGSVLARLGLARPRSPEARRRRLSRGARRAFLCAAAVSAAGAVFLLHRAAAATRAPAATIPVALKREIGRQRETVDRALAGLRDLPGAPAREPDILPAEQSTSE